MPDKELSLEEIQSFKGKYPKQIWPLFFSEMWERFCFYGMRGMLTFFMINELFFDATKANLQYGATQAWVYAFTFIGGMFADKILGFRRSLFWGGLLMITGSILLAIDPHQFFFLGISFNIIGTGFFKPNISTMVGMLYKDGDYRRDAGFSLFYSGINIGALLGGYICIAIGKGTLAANIVPSHLRWNFAFGFAAVVMTISLLTFLKTRKSLGPIGLSPFTETEEKTGIKKWYKVFVFIGSLAVIPVIMKMVANTEYTDWFMYCIGPFSLIFLFYEMTRLKREQVHKLFAALLFIIFSVLFWAIFEQAGGSLNIFAANNVSSKLLGVITLDPNGVNNSANSLFVIIFAPILGIIWIAMAKKKIEPNTIIKFGIAFIFLGLAFYVLFSMRFFSNAQGVSSLDIFTLSYFVVTLGELCLSPIGLSIMTKLSPAKLQGFMMGMWFLASAYGQYVAGIFGAGIAADLEHANNYEKLLGYTSGYKQFGLYAIIAGVIILAISPLMKKLMHGVK
ncbi:MAG TPA: peptide MFS transporter [Chitinophagaceae bacterium]|nr:peptide MFS transporter [Chitinophagaceae bacterium]